MVKAQQLDTVPVLNHALVRERALDPRNNFEWGLDPGPCGLGPCVQSGIAQGYRQDNPAGDAIGGTLPKNGVAKTHHRALPHAKVWVAITPIRASRANLARVAPIEFLILTAA